MATTNTPVGYTPTTEVFGDSLAAGAGGSGQNIPSCLAALMPHRLINNFGIGGQTAEQAAARQGGLPVTLNISGGVLLAGHAATACTPSVALLSTATDNTTRYLSGTIAGNAVLLSRTATGGPPSTTETYTVMSAGNPSAVTVPAWAPFTPDQGWNARDSIQVLVMGRNNVPSALGTVPGLLAACVAQIHDPKRYVVVGVLAAVSETNGTSSKNAIDTTNAALAAAHGDRFVPFTPPTPTELAVAGYTPTTQDQTEITAGVWPQGLRADAVHLLGSAYMIMALRIKAVIDAQGW